MNLDQLSKLFRARAANCVVEVGDRLKHAQSHKSFDQAWNDCALDLVTCSRVHCYYVMLHNFISVLQDEERMKDANVKKVMTNVCLLFALQNIAEDFGNFDFTRLQKSAIREAIRKLLDLLRPDIVALCDSFEFPDNALNSALGKYDGNVYEALYESSKNSPLNEKEPFTGYQEILKPILDLDFIKEHKAQQRQGPLRGAKL